MKKGQSNRLTEQQKEGQGPVTIFHKDAKFHDAEVGSTSELAMIKLKNEFSMLKFRYRKNLSKKEINEALKKIDDFLGQTLFWRRRELSQMVALLKFKMIMENGELFWCQRLNIREKILRILEQENWLERKMIKILCRLEMSLRGHIKT